MPRLTNIKVVIAWLRLIASSKCLTEEDELDVETLLDLERIYQDIESIAVERMKIEKLRELVRDDIRWDPTALHTIADQDI
jgi:hypothetical protein